MAKKNKPSPKPEAVIQEPVVAEEVVEVAAEPVVEIEEPEIVDAEVSGVTDLLNVRATPEKRDGNVVTQIKNGLKIKVVDPKKSTNDWYKIIVTDKDKKTDGYAMKKYIKIV